MEMGRQPEPIRRKVRSAKEILDLTRQIELDTPKQTDPDFSYLCARCPEVRQMFKAYLQDGYSRSGARAMIKGVMSKLAEDSPSDD